MHNRAEGDFRMPPEQFKKLKIAPGSKFFTEENGEIYFHLYSPDYMLNIKNGNAHIQHIISALGCYDWYEFRRNYSVYTNKESTEKFNLAGAQIQFWKELG